MSSNSPNSNVTKLQKQQRQRSEASQMRIVEAAIHCIHAYGYHGTSMQIIANEAGLSKGAIQHQFRTKAQIMLEVARYSLSKHARYRQQYSDSLSSTGLQWLKETTESSWEIAKDPSCIALVEVMMAMRSDLELQEGLNNMHEQIKTWRQNAINTIATKLGVEACPDIEAIVNMHNNMVRGLAIGFMYNSDERTLRQAFEAHQASEILLAQKAIEAAE